MINKKFFIVLVLISSINIKVIYGQSRKDSLINDIISRMTLSEKINMLGGGPDMTTIPLERIGIPKVQMSDGPCGVFMFGKTTYYAASISLAASWNTDLAKKIGISVGKEANAKGVNIMLAPAINIHRAPMCGRNFEYLGEDPFLAGKIALNYIIGLQSQGVMATVKHFAANNQEFDRHWVSSDMDERTLQEIYLPAFKMCVKEANVACVMTSYNLLNGTHASQNNHLINEILKNDWGFKGFVMSDWISVYDGVAAASGGLDIEMPWAKYMCIDTLIPAVNNKLLAETVINDKIRRMLGCFYDYGLIGKDNKKLTQKPKLEMNEVESNALNVEREGIVLLKNEGSLLPLKKEKVKSIVVVGPNAYPAVIGGGGSSEVHPNKEISILEAIKKIAPKDVKVNYFEVLTNCRFATEHDNLNSIYTIDSTGKIVNGMTSEYFTNMDLEGKPFYTRIDKIIDLSNDTNDNSGFGIGGKNFSIRWKGKIKVSEAGSLRFVVSGDDGYRLFIDDKLIIDSWKLQSETTSCAVYDLVPGKEYNLRLEYFQAEGDYAIRFGCEKYADEWNLMLNAAKTSDVAVICVGFNNTIEGEGKDRPFGLPKEQVKLISDMYKANKKTIVVLNAGGNAGIGEWIDSTAGLLHAWYPGQEGAIAVAEIIFGMTNPSGKLPISIEKNWNDNATYESYYDDDNDKKVFYKEGIFLGYRHFDKDTVEPLFPFGYGLSYTAFKYEDIQVNKEKFKIGDSIKLSLKVTNTGQYDGSEIVEVYVRDEASVEQRPEKELKGFSKIFLKKGQTVDVTVYLNKDSFSYFSSRENTWIAEPGKFEILVGSSSKDIRLKKEIELVN